jgi:membrane associated rhomboid family serine protease
MFFFLIPIHVDVPMRCKPWMNWVIIALTVLMFPLCVWAGELTALGSHLMLGGESLIGMIGHILVHGDIFHLLGNMLFLWVFGNAVCAKVGNLAYPFVYVGLGFAAGVISTLIDPGPAIGASGAINGIVGMFVAWYLFNEITCWYAVWIISFARAGGFAVSSFWIILFWAAFDLWGALSGDGSIGYVAHLAGFAAGIGLAILLQLLGWIEIERGEKSLLEVIGKGKPTKKRRKKPTIRKRT